MSKHVELSRDQAEALIDATLFLLTSVHCDAADRAGHFARQGAIVIAEAFGMNTAEVEEAGG